MLSGPSSRSPPCWSPVTLRQLHAVVAILRGGPVLLLTGVIEERA